MQQQRFKLRISLNYAIIPENRISKRVVALKAVEVNLFHVTHVLVNLMIDYLCMAGQRLWVTRYNKASLQISHHIIT